MEVTPFEVSVTWDDGEPTLHIRGEVEFGTAPQLGDVLAEVLDKGVRNISLDFQQVTFLDSEGLKVLLSAYRRLRDRGGSLAVTGCSHFVAKTFEILGLGRYFDIGEDGCPDKPQQ